jgi:hypothetical protein
VFAVPRSTAISRPRNASALLMWNEDLPDGHAGCFWILLQDLLAETSAHGPSSFIYQRRAA